MPTTTTPPLNTTHILISYLQSHPDIAQEMYEDLALGQSMAEVDREANPVTCHLNSVADIHTYMSQLHAD